MNTSITIFEEDKYYVMMGKGRKWSDFDGPFDSVEQGIEFLKRLCGQDNSVPEVINGSTLVYFKNQTLDVVKINSKIVDGKMFAKWLGNNNG